MFTKHYIVAQGPANISCCLFLCLDRGGWVYLYSFICLSAGVVEWKSLLCYDSIASCTSKGDISASAICHFWRFILIDWYTGRPS